MAVQRDFYFSSDDSGLVQMVAEDPYVRAVLSSLASLVSSELCEARSVEASHSSFMVALFACSFSLSPMNSSSWCRWILMDTFYSSWMMSD